MTSHATERTWFWDQPRSTREFCRPRWTCVRSVATFMVLMCWRRAHRNGGGWHARLGSIRDAGGKSSCRTKRLSRLGMPGSVVAASLTDRSFPSVKSRQSSFAGCPYAERWPGLRTPENMQGAEAGKHCHDIPVCTTRNESMIETAKAKPAAIPETNPPIRRNLKVRDLITRISGIYHRRKSCIF